MKKILHSFFPAVLMGLLFSTPAMAEPVPKWELDDLYTRGIEGCLIEEPDWTRQECADLWACYVEGVEVTFENDYTGYRQFVYELETDTLSLENNDNLMFVEAYCMFGF